MNYQTWNVEVPMRHPTHPIACYPPTFVNITGPHLLRIIVSLTLAAASLAAGQKVELHYLAPDAATAGKMRSALTLDAIPPQDTMEIYFFDTPSLTLLKDQHLILRLRKKGKTWTFTVKERPTHLPPEADGYPGTLEIDESISTGEKVPAYSVDCNPSMASVKAAIEEESIRPILSLPQQDFLKERLNKIPWAEVRCFPKIEARSWKLPDSANLTAEEWKYPGGEFLELSYKSTSKDPTTDQKKFTTYLTAHTLKPEAGGALKTPTALEALAKQLPKK